jgi:hypothetical protein
LVANDVGCCGAGDEDAGTGAVSARAQAPKVASAIIMSRRRCRRITMAIV